MADKPENKKQAASRTKKKPGGSALQNKSFAIPRWAIYAVLAFTALIYIRALFNGFVNLDDDAYLFDNPFIRNFSLQGISAIFSNFYEANYHPLTTLTYLFEYRIYGLNPLPYHALNVLLHLVNIMLVYKLVEKLSENKLSALLVSLLFALHPMHVESVAWVSERKDVLYTLFYLGSLLAYHKYLASGMKSRHYWICLLLFVLSLLSKSAAITLPILLIAVDLYKKRKLNATMFLEKLPFLALAVLFGILALLSQQQAFKPVSVSYTFIDRIFLFSYTISFYIVKLVAPFSLSVMHYYPNTGGGALPWYYYASLPFLLIMVWLVVRRSDFRREKLFGIFFFLIVISIMLQVVSVGDTITAERYTYVSYIGLFFIAGQWIAKIQKNPLKKTALVVGGIFIIMCTYLTWERISVWKDGKVLFTDVVKKYPESYPAYWMRGNIYYKHNDNQKALQDYNKSIQLFPDFAPSLAARAKVLLKGFNDPKSALPDLNRSIQLDSTIAETYSDRGMAFAQTGDTAASLRDFNKAIKLKPELSKAYINRSALKANMGNTKGALEDINKAITLDPKDGEAYRNRAAIKNMLQDFSGSINDCNAAIKIDPKDKLAFFNRGQSRFNLSDTAGACLDWSKALDLGFTPAEAIINQVCK